MSEARICLACGAEVHGPETHVCPTHPTSSPQSALRAALPRVGDVLEDRWELLDEISEGGSGTVFRARDRALDLDVAVKILPPGGATESAVRRLKREIRITRDVDHPNVSRVFDLGTWRDFTFFTMRLVDGDSLGARVKRDGPLPGPALVALARGLLDALVAAHRLGIVHRDVKPANVLVTADGTPVLVDFGVAVDTGMSPLAQERRGERITPDGAIVGTPAFMAPEQLRGEPATPATDVHGLALTLAFAATGKIGRPSERAWAAFGRGFAKTLPRCLEPDPARRPRSANALFEEVVRAERRPARIATFAAIVAALGVVLGIAWWSARAARPRAGVPVVWVRPLENRTGDPGLDWLEHGVSDLVSAGFETAGSIRFAMDAEARRQAARVDGRIVLEAGAPVVELVLSDPDRTVAARDRIPAPTGDGLFREIDEAVRAFLGALGARVPPPRTESSPPLVAVDADAFAHYARARDLVRRHSVGAALDELRLATMRDPGFALAHLERHVMMTYWVLGSQEEAQASLERARTHRDRLPPSQRDLLDAIVDARRRDFRKLRSFLRARPADSATYHMAFRAYFASRDERRDLLEEWIARLPQDGEPHNLLGYELDREFLDPEGAEREFRTYIRLAPDNPNAFDSYGDFLRRKGRAREAIETYDRGLAIDPTFGPSAMGAVQATLQLDDLADAERRLEAIRGRVSIDSTAYDAYVAGWLSLPLLRGDRRGALDRAQAIATDPLVGSRGYLAREYQAILFALGNEAGRARAAVAEADRLHRNYHGAARGLPSLGPYVEALLAVRREDLPALDAAIAALAEIRTPLERILAEPRMQIAEGLRLRVRGDADAAAERLSTVIRSDAYGGGFYAALERARLLVLRGRLPEASAAYADAGRFRDQALWMPEAALEWRACLEEAASLAHRLGDEDRARALDARRAKLR